MADTVKLAGTFLAWRLILGVRPYYLKRALDRCEELFGLRPKVIGEQPASNDELHVQFVVYLLKDKYDRLELFIEEHLSGFHAVLLHGAEAQLMCPLPKVDDASAPERIENVSKPSPGVVASFLRDVQFFLTHRDQDDGAIRILIGWIQSSLESLDAAPIHMIRALVATIKLCMDKIAAHWSEVAVSECAKEFARRARDLLV